MRIALITTSVCISAALAAVVAVGCSKSHSGQANPEPPGGSTTVASTSGGTTGGAGGGAPVCMGAFCSDASNCGAQGHSCLGGACQAGNCQPLVLSPAVVANQIVLDAANVYVGLALVPVQGQPCSGQARVASFARASGVQTTIRAVRGHVVGENDNTYAMTVFGGNVFWSIFNEPNDAIGAMYTVPTSGGTPASMGDSNGSLTLASDGAALYYSRAVNFPRGVSRMSPDGTNATILSSHLANFLALGSDTVYFSEDPCFGSGDEEGCEAEPTIYAVPKAGGTTTMVTASAEGLFTLLQQDGYLYWFLLGDAAPNPAPILRVPVTGGEPSTVATSPLIQALAVDATNVYWVDLIGDNLNQYNVAKAPVAGGEKTGALLGGWTYLGRKRHRRRRHGDRVVCVGQALPPREVTCSPRIVIVVRPAEPRDGRRRG